MRKNKETKRKRMPLPLKIALGILCAAVIGLAGVLIRLLIQENNVPREVSGIGMEHEAIIVLGAQVKPDGTPSVQLDWRLDAAAEAYRRKPVPVVVCGAQGADEPAPEADVMKACLMERGVPESDILTDPDSRNTEENLRNAGKLLQEHGGINRVLVVSSDYHVPRAMALARDLGFEASGLGSPCKPEYWLKNHGRETLAWIKYWMKKYLRLH